MVEANAHVCRWRACSLKCSKAKPELKDTIPLPPEDALREMRLQRLLSDGTRAKISARHKGKTLSPETRAAISAKLKGRTRSAETRAKISAGHLGKAKPRKARDALTT